MMQQRSLTIYPLDIGSDSTPHGSVALVHVVQLGLLETPLDNVQYFTLCSRAQYHPYSDL